MSNTSPRTTAAPRGPARWEQRLIEAFDELWDTFVDPTEPLVDDDGLRWRLLGRGGGPDRAGESLPLAESQLAEIRAQCRALAVENEFAINGHENRISYIVGTGHRYRAAASRGAELPGPLVEEVQRLLDDFVRQNRWHQRQQEIVRRRDRDGEVFLRLFPAADGVARVRFVEPGQVATPPEHAGDPAARFGVLSDPDDVETVRGYFVDGRLVDAAEIQHRKAHVDANVKRGLPLFYPVRKNLRRAEKLLRNMTVLAEIQSAIALIRKHHAGTRTSVEQFVQQQADATATSPRTGRTSHVCRYAPGTILDAMAGTEYEFPSIALDASRYVAVLQAELRAIAARLVMPEFMLTSDASNANYASTMVAEGPAVKMFARLQHEMIEDDLELLGRVLGLAVDAGRLPPAALSGVSIRAIPPTLAVRDRLKETQADQILLRNQVMSRTTMALRHDLDPEEERRLLDEG